ncbi:MAG: molybdenum ABC transporter ATP-binding protein [Burkholderiales bacterium]
MIDISIVKNLGGFALNAQLQIAEFGLTALFGRSGAGKTSVIKAIAGLLRPDSGHVRIGGKYLFDAATGVDIPVHQRRVGYVFQEGRLFPHLRVRDNLVYGAKRATGGIDQGELQRIVTMLGLDALLQRWPHDLSGGEKQRVAIGRALLSQPELLLMDEPLASLDAPRKREILPYLERLRDQMRLPIVYVSHAIEEVTRLADQIAILDEGRVIAVGTPGELGERLDVRPLLGEFEAGAVIDATVVSHDTRFDLSTLSFSGGALRVPGLAGVPGSRLRVRVRARDVALASERPSSISVQNIFAGVVREIVEEQGAYAELRLSVGDTKFISRVTRESVHRLGLTVDTKVYLLVKSVSFDRETVSMAPNNIGLENNVHSHANA